MKRVEATSEPSAPVSTVSEATATSSASVGDPLDDLLGDFNSPTTDDSSSNEEGSNSSVRMVNDDSGTDFGQSRSNHSNRKVRKVKKIKRPRKSL